MICVFWCFFCNTVNVHILRSESCNKVNMQFMLFCLVRFSKIAIVVWTPALKIIGSIPLKPFSLYIKLIKASGIKSLNKRLNERVEFTLSFTEEVRRWYPKGGYRIPDRGRVCCTKQRQGKSRHTCAHTPLPPPPPVVQYAMPPPPPPYTPYSLSNSNEVAPGPPSTCTPPPPLHLTKYRLTQIILASYMDVLQGVCRVFSFLCHFFKKD